MYLINAEQTNEQIMTMSRMAKKRRENVLSTPDEIRVAYS
jgi:hypothetical protein